MIEKTNIADIRQKLESEERQLWEALTAIENSPEYIAATKSKAVATAAWCNVYRKLEAIKLLEAQ